MKKASHLSECVKGTLSNMKSFGGNFGTCPDGNLWGVENVTCVSQHRNEAQTFNYT